MSEKNADGGRAFPRAGSEWDGNLFDHRLANHQDGMSLRDWFAGMALQGLLVWHARAIPECSIEEPILDYPIAAYKMADAMLKVRGE